MIFIIHTNGLLEFSKGGKWFYLEIRTPIDVQFGVSGILLYLQCDSKQIFLFYGMILNEIFALRIL